MFIIRLQPVEAQSWGSGDRHALVFVGQKD